MKWAKTTLISFKIDGDYVAVSKKVLDSLYSDNTAEKTLQNRSKQFVKLEKHF